MCGGGTACLESLGYQEAHFEFLPCVESLRELERPKDLFIQSLDIPRDPPFSNKPSYLKNTSGWTQQVKDSKSTLM